MLIWQRPTLRRPRSASVDGNSRPPAHVLSRSASANSRVNEPDKKHQFASSSNRNTKLTASQTSRRKKKDDFKTSFLDDIKNRLHAEVHFSSAAKGDPVMVGRWPAWANSISVRDNPVAFWDSVPSPPTTLSREHFSAPNVLFCVPELQMPRFYPRGKPKCIWHGTTDCVEIKGWSPSARFGIDETGPTACWSKCYGCKVRESEDRRPFSFLGHSPAALAQAPQYVQNWWREHGFYFSHRQGVRWRIIDRMRTAVGQGGLGSAGFLKGLADQHRRTHLSLTQMWRDYTTLAVRKPCGEQHGR